jgi:formate dehydrogenase maturation protein FdhE
MAREKCENCGKFQGTYDMKLKQDYNGQKKGTVVSVEGCKSCQTFVQV